MHFIATTSAAALLSLCVAGFASSASYAAADLGSCSPYAGAAAVDPQRLHQALLKLGKKDQFETSDDYMARLRAALPWLVKGAESFIEVRAKVPSHSIKYNADARQLSIGGMFSGPFFGIHGDMPMMEKEAATDTYKASNAYGAKRDVVKISRTLVSASFEGVAPWKKKETKETIVPLDAATAKKVVNDIHAVFIGRFVNAYSGRDWRPPTIRAPTDVVTNYSVVVIEPVCGVYYSKAAGALADIPLSNAKR